MNDPRDPTKNTCRMVTNFDVLTNPRGMTPYRSSEDGDSAAATSQKQNFCIAYTGASLGWRLFALGVKSGAATAQVLTKAVTTGGTSDLGDNSWSSTIGNNESSSGTTDFKLFVYYKKTGKIYGARASRYIWSMMADGSAWADSERDLTSITNLAQGLVHSKDDILYIPYDNKIAKNDNGVWTDAALTLPTYYYITSISEYGNYLAIACAPLSGVGKSYVYLWDRDSSLATITESINWGDEVLKVLDEVDGYLIGISIDAGQHTIQDKIVIRYLAGITTSKATKLMEFRGGSNSTTLAIAKQKIHNRLYFLMKITFNGAVREGLWSIGRTSQANPFILTHERTSNNDTALGTGTLLNFFIVGDIIFISFINNSTVYVLTKTDDQATYSVTAIYEKRFNSINSSIKKKLLGATVMTEFLPTDGQSVLKYRKDEQTSWTTIFTNTTNDSISQSATKDASGANLPEEKEIEFRIESTGGAVITGFRFQEETLDKDIY